MQMQIIMPIMATATIILSFIVFGALTSPSKTIPLSSHVWLTLLALVATAFVTGAAYWGIQNKSTKSGTDIHLRCEAAVTEMSKLQLKCSNVSGENLQISLTDPLNLRIDIKGKEI
jgi:hypothetical protein